MERVRGESRGRDSYGVWGREDVVGCKGSSLRYDMMGDIPHTASEDRREKYMVALESGMVNLLVVCLSWPGGAAKGALIPAAGVFFSHGERSVSHVMMAGARHHHRSSTEGVAVCSLAWIV